VFVTDVTRVLPKSCSSIDVFTVLVFIPSELYLIRAWLDGISTFEESVGERKDETGSQSLENLDSSVFTLDELFLDDK
jgi:hypothetical protein